MTQGCGQLRSGGRRNRLHVAPPAPPGSLRRRPRGSAAPRGRGMAVVRAPLGPVASVRRRMPQMVASLAPPAPVVAHVPLRTPRTAASPAACAPARPRTPRTAPSPVARGRASAASPAACAPTRPRTPRTAPSPVARGRASRVPRRMMWTVVASLEALAGAGRTRAAVPRGQGAQRASRRHHHLAGPWREALRQRVRWQCSTHRSSGDPTPQWDRRAPAARRRMAAAHAQSFTSPRRTGASRGSTICPQSSNSAPPKHSARSASAGDRKKRSALPKFGARVSRAMGSRSLWRSTAAAASGPTVAPSETQASHWG